MMHNPRIFNIVARFLTLSMIFCSVSFAQDHSQALIEAAKQGDLEQVRELLDKGADVNVRYINGMTVLMAAARGGNLEIVKLLIEKGADVNSSDRFGRTVFSSAARGGTWK